MGDPENVKEDDHPDVYNVGLDASLFLLLLLVVALVAAVVTLIVEISVLLLLLLLCMLLIVHVGGGRCFCFRTVKGGEKMGAGGMGGREFCCRLDKEGILHLLLSMFTSMFMFMFMWVCSVSSNDCESQLGSSLSFKGLFQLLPGEDGTGETSQLSSSVSASASVVTTVSSDAVESFSVIFMLVLFMFMLLLLLGLNLSGVGGGKRIMAASSVLRFESSTRILSRLICC
mmetsp:Transcript_13232/g.16105  ORF Transcript_13232/g.16105 Transcript_13232/m.16105 type:complete len:229 (-) Transcript_13232:527-1213(-)